MHHFVFLVILVLNFSTGEADADAAGSRRGGGRRRPIVLTVPIPCQAEVLYEQQNYICVNNEIRCLPGWQNADNYCRDPSCPEGCDLERGICTKPNFCHCRSGYFGHACQNCVVLPGCLHGTCDKAYECNCLPGWKGYLCSQAICRPGCDKETGFCDKPNLCSCHVGWQGENCTECSPLPGCGDNGHCNLPLECNCEDGWTGEFCDEPICKENCHPVHGSCEEPNTCMCENGYQGELCDECRPYPGCLHGSCRDPWTCNCKDGWRGILCDIPISAVTRGNNKTKIPPKKLAKKGH